MAMSESAAWNSNSMYRRNDSARARVRKESRMAERQRSVWNWNSTRRRNISALARARKGSRQKLLEARRGSSAETLKLRKCLAEAKRALASRDGLRDAIVRKRLADKADALRQSKPLVGRTVQAVNSALEGETRAIAFVGGGTAWNYLAACKSNGKLDKTDAAFAQGNLDMWVLVPDQDLADATVAALQDEFADQATATAERATTFFRPSPSFWVTDGTDQGNEVIYVQVVVAYPDLIALFQKKCLENASDAVRWCPGEDSAVTVAQVGHCLNFVGLMLTNFILKAKFVRRMHKGVDIDTMRYEAMLRALPAEERTAVAVTLLGLANTRGVPYLIPDIHNATQMILSFCALNYTPGLLVRQLTKAYMPDLHRLVVAMADDPELRALGAEVLLVGGHAVRFYTDSILHSNDVDAKLYVDAGNHDRACAAVRRIMNGYITHVHTDLGNAYNAAVPESLNLEFAAPGGSRFQQSYRRAEVPSRRMSEADNSIRLTSVREGGRVDALRGEHMTLSGAEEDTLLPYVLARLRRGGLGFDQKPITYAPLTMRVREQEIASDSYLMSLDMRISFRGGRTGNAPEKMRMIVPILDVVVSERPAYQKGVIVDRFGGIPVANLNWWCNDFVNLYLDDASAEKRLFQGKTAKDRNRLGYIQSLVEDRARLSRARWSRAPPPVAALQELTRVSDAAVIHRTPDKRLGDTAALYRVVRHRLDAGRSLKPPFIAIDVRPFVRLLRKRHQVLVKNGAGADYSLGERHLIRLTNQRPPQNTRTLVLKTLAAIIDPRWRPPSLGPDEWVINPKSMQALKVDGATWNRLIYDNPMLWSGVFAQSIRFGSRNRPSAIAKIQAKALQESVFSNRAQAEEDGSDDQGPVGGDDPFDSDDPMMGDWDGGR